MRALVTGGAGFIGSHLVVALRDAGWQVVVLDNLSTGFASNLPDGVEFLEGEAAREDMNPRPLSHYAVQKLACEHYCGMYQRLRGLDTVCLRYFNIFGPRQSVVSPYTGVIAKFLGAALAGEPPVIFGDGGQTRDFCHVADVVAATLAAAVRPAAEVAGGVFNIGTGNSVSVLDLAAEFRRLFPGLPEPRHEPGKRGEIRASRADITRARKHLAYAPAIPFAEGLAGLVTQARS